MSRCASAIRSATEAGVFAYPSGEFLALCATDGATGSEPVAALWKAAEGLLWTANLIQWTRDAAGR